MAESSVGWFIVREKYYLLAEKVRTSEHGDISSFDKKRYSSCRQVWWPGGVSAIYDLFTYAAISFAVSIFSGRMMASRQRTQVHEDHSTHRFRNNWACSPRWRSNGTAFCCTHRELTIIVLLVMATTTSSSAPAWIPTVLNLFLGWGCSNYAMPTVSFHIMFCSCLENLLLYTLFISWQKFSLEIERAWFGITLD